MTDLIAELAAQSKWLHKAAAEIAAEGHAGWGNTCLQAAETIDAHAAEIEAMARDARRYRWLRDDAPDEWEINCWVGQTMQEVLIDPSELDAAIDAAMRSAKEDGNEG